MGARPLVSRIKTTWVQRQPERVRCGVLSHRPSESCGAPAEAPHLLRGKVVLEARGLGKPRRAAPSGRVSSPRRQTGPHRPQGRRSWTSARALIPRTPGALSLGVQGVPPTDAPPPVLQTLHQEFGGRSSSLRTPACAPPSSEQPAQPTLQQPAPSRAEGRRGQLHERGPLPG